MSENLKEEEKHLHNLAGLYLYKYLYSDDTNMTVFWKETSIPISIQVFFLTACSWFSPSSWIGYSSCIPGIVVPLIALDHLLIAPVSLK